MYLIEMKKRITALILCAALAFAVCACEITPAQSASGAYGNSSGAAIAENEPFTLSEIGEAVVHTSEQKQFLSMENLYNVSRVADGTKEKSRPLPVKLEWKDNTNKQAVYTRVYVSENADMSDPLTLITMEDKVSVYNLKVGVKYYWKVSAVFKDGSVTESRVAEFTTENECPRNVYVDGSTNWRDLGGWTTKSGKKVRQGLIYRTGRLNTSNIDSSVAEITAEGIKEATLHLKIKTEIDLRGKSESSNITASVLGEDVNYYLCPMNYESDLLSINADMVKKVFGILSDEDNYPVIFHCHIGTDRTGFVAYLINGLLGVSKQDLYKDYLFSNFGNIGSSRSMDDIADRYVASLDDFGGADLSEKIRNYLISVGVTQEQINAVVSILT